MVGISLVAVLPGGGLAEVHGTGCGDVFGDLVHILRDAETGQPIYQKHQILYPGETEPADGYCPIPLDADGAEIPLAELSCDPADPEAVVEVDYFGRLSGGRTKERNLRMHFNEVISSIKDAGRVKVDESGRLLLGYDCDENGKSCESWSAIDSPMENLALYMRLMKYGHFQTDPSEVDLWAHGDPELGVQYHPALDEADWAKFACSLRHLLPLEPGSSAAEELDTKDFVRAGAFLGGAANKGGKITVDLVQYLNRILKIAQKTETTVANVKTLPALIRDEDDNITEATSEVAERFVDFSAMEYLRDDWHDGTLEILRPFDPDDPEGSWVIDKEVSLQGWLEFANGTPASPPANIAGFVEAATESLRTIEFIHNYAIPENLGWNFYPETE